MVEERNAGNPRPWADTLTSIPTTPEQSNPDASLLESGLGQPINADIALGIDPQIIISNLQQMGMSVERATSFVQALRARFDALPEAERETKRSSVRLRIAGVHGRLANGQTREELVKIEMAAGQLTRQQAEGIVNYAATTWKSAGETAANKPAVSQILAQVPKLAADFLKQGYPPAATAEVLAMQWQCSLAQAEAMVKAGQAWTEHKPIPITDEKAAEKSAPVAEKASPPGAPGAPLMQNVKAWLSRKSVRAGMIFLGMLLGLYLAYGFYLAAPVGRFYAIGNCQGVSKTASVVRRFYIFPVTTSIRAKADECNLYLAARAYEDKGNWRRAYESYAYYLAKYPQGAIQDVRPGASRSLYAWAQEQAAAGEFQAAIENLETLTSQFTDQPEAGPALQAVPQVHLDWALALASDGYFQEALNALAVIPQKYVNFPQAVMARRAVPNVYVQWGFALAADGDFEEGQEKLKLALQQDPLGASHDWVTRLLPAFYQEWAAALMEDGHYQDALAVYEGSGELFRDDGPANEGMARVYMQWAGSLSKSNDFRGALDKLSMAGDAVADGALKPLIEGQQEGVLEAFSSSSGPQAEAAMEEMSQSLCEAGELPKQIAPIFGTDPEYVFMRIWPVGSALGAEPGLVAATPAQMHYVVCLELRTVKIQSCPYQGGHTLIRQRRSWAVRMYNTDKGSLVGETVILGGMPYACGSIHYFVVGSPTDVEIGTFPSYTDLKNWFSPRLK
jgi:tetratricopeptide (TPR) repeat protein